MADTGNRPYKQVARAEAQERTREALMESAVDEFYKGRWGRVSLEALARRAGVTKQTLLRHFGSKDGLLLQALARGSAKLLEQRWSAPQGDLDGIVENLVDHYEEWGERAMRIGAWQLSGNPMLAKLSEVARRVHYEWVDYAFMPWLEELEAQERTRLRATLIALCDLQVWWLLSHDLGLARAEVHAVLANAIGRVLA